MKQKTILCVVVLLLICSYCCRNKNINVSANQTPHLCIYNYKYILNYLKDRGYNDFRPDKISRNSLGTILYFYDYYSNSQTNTILSVNVKGEIKEIDSPAKFSYINDDGDFVAWFDDMKKGVQLKNGQITIPLHLSFEIDYSGKYFVVPNYTGMTEVFRVEAPDKAIGRTKFFATNIFVKNNKVYLFARNYRDVKSPGNYEQHEIICQIFNEIEGKLDLKEEIHINRPSTGSSPFVVIDLDMWSNCVLLKDVKDEPFSFLTSFYLFDLESKQMKKVDQKGDYGFFLHDNILK